MIKHANNIAKPNLILGYRGASGGFFLLHLIMLSGSYSVAWEGGFSFEQVIDKQWRISDPSHWKDSEIWPNNFGTLDLCDHRPKILFFCNPNINDFVYGPVSDLITAYQSIKDPSWPLIRNFQDYLNLPGDIREECEQIHNLAKKIQWLYEGLSKAKRIWIYTDISSQEILARYKKAYVYYDPMKKIPMPPAANWESYLVDSNAIPGLESSHIRIYLQDLLRNLEILVDMGIVDTINDKQQEFAKMWLNLHDPSILEQIGLGHECYKNLQGDVT